MNADASNTDVAADGKPDNDALVKIVAACLRGNQDAQRQLYDSCRQRVFSLAVRMVGIQDAGDVTQLVFMQAFGSLAQFSGKSKFETWLYRLAVNESLQFLRRNRRWPQETLDWEPMEDANFDEDAERKELLEKSLAQIDPELRSLFLLREVEQLSYRQIAEVLSIPEGTVGSRLNRARRELQKQLSKLGFEQ